MLSRAPSGVVTLTTDFGLQDHYVGVMKGVILSIFPTAQLIDLSHQVTPYSIEQGAFFVRQSYRFFPPGTVHMAVVDPGVGTARRPLAAMADGHFFIAPDNGLLGWALEGVDAQVAVIDAERWGLKPMSKTFHGRDLFSPAAAWLAHGKPFSEIGPVITDWIRPEEDLPARVLNVDRFGNIVTSLRPGDLTARFRLRIGEGVIETMAENYGDAPGDRPFAVIGSSGLVEVSLRQGSAAEALAVHVGDGVELDQR